MNTNAKNKTILEGAEFWLGQVTAIARLEREGALTKAAALTGIQNTLRRMDEKVRFPGLPVMPRGRPEGEETGTLEAPAQTENGKTLPADHADKKQTNQKEPNE